MSMLDYYSAKNKSPCEDINYGIFLKAFFNCIHNWIFYNCSGIYLPDGLKVSFTISAEGNNIYLFYIMCY
jgi:hypothetical protein